jgi:hypothetical protein
LVLVWNYFKVLPRYRDKGISSQLIQWALEDYSLSEHYVWCSASIDEIQAFKDHGWQEVGFVDIDLSEIKGKSRGYGIHRTYGMVRNPGPLKYKP